MKNQILLLRIAGYISLLFVVFHLFFYPMFNWENALNGLSGMNRAIFLTYHAICILMLLFMGIIPIFQTKSLLGSSLKYGILSLFLLFYPMLNWENALNGLSSMNRAIFLTYHAICILMLFFMGIIPLFQAKSLLSSSFRYSILSFFSFFYLIRIVAEFTLFGISSSSPAILIMCLVPMIFYSIPLFSKQTIK